VVEHLPSKLEALSSNSITPKKKKKERKEKRGNSVNMRLVDEP
jgi:hypothetical protein